MEGVSNRKKWRLVYPFITVCVSVTVSLAIHLFTFLRKMLTDSTAINVPSYLPNLLISLMFTSNMTFGMLTWYRVTKYKLPIKRWLLIGGTIILVCGFSLSVTLLWEVNVYWICAMSVLAITTSVGNGIAFGASMCAVPHIIPFVFCRSEVDGDYSDRIYDHDPARVYWCLLLLLAMGTAIGFTMPALFLYSPVVIQVFFPMATALLFALVITSARLLKNFTHRIDLVCPIKVAWQTLRSGRPLSACLCTFVYSYLIGYLLTFKSPVMELPVNNTFVKSEEFDQLNAKREILLSSIFVCMPCVPLIIRCLLMKHSACLVMEPIVCFIYAVLCYIFDDFSIYEDSLYYFLWLLGFSLVGAVQIAVAYTDLMWQVFDATQDSGNVMVGSSAIKNLMCTAGTVAGMLMPLQEAVVLHFHFFFLWTVPAAVSALTLVINVVQSLWDTCSDSSDSERHPIV